MKIRLFSFSFIFCSTKHSFVLFRRTRSTEQVLWIAARKRANYFINGGKMLAFRFSLFRFSGLFAKFTWNELWLCHQQLPQSFYYLFHLIYALYCTFHFEASSSTFNINEEKRRKKKPQSLCRLAQCVISTFWRMRGEIKKTAFSFQAPEINLHNFHWNWMIARMSLFCRLFSIMFAVLQ